MYTIPSTEAVAPAAKKSPADAVPERILFAVYAVVDAYANAAVPEELIVNNSRG